MGGYVLFARERSEGLGKGGGLQRRVPIERRETRFCKRLYPGSKKNARLGYGILLSSSLSCQLAYSWNRRH